MGNIKKNDTVVVLAGRDKGKTGKVLRVFPKEERAIVEGVNFVKKHVRKTRDDQQGGIIQKESLINLSNLALMCRGCNRPTRIGVKVLADGTKSRYCKKCDEVLS
jgi:large subunit ribosomal protein L24